MRLQLATFLIVCGLTAAHAQTAPEGYWPETRSREILDRTQTIRLAPDLSSLAPAEQRALAELIAAGHIMQRLYELSRHAEAPRALQALQDLDRSQRSPRWSQNLLQLYRLNQGPIATTISNERLPFLPVRPQVPGRNVYPADVTRAEIEAFLNAHPDQRTSILDERTVVRRATRESIDIDLSTLRQHAVLRTLHTDVEHHLQQLAKSRQATRFYAVPYAVAYADELLAAHGHLISAAHAIGSSDAEFARYLRHRARDLLTNDYEAGDASWVTGRFQRLNAQIGAYETYDDALFGVKAFHSLSILKLNTDATTQLRQALSGLQDIENALPYESHKRVRDDIPVGVYEVVADFGQSRGVNTATILPNDALFSRRYGRTILMRENIMKNAELFAPSLRAWQAVVAAEHANELVPEGNFHRTLWHEIGHYVGPDRDRQGRTLDVALEDYADAMEEMKSDLVSLFALHRMKHPSLRAVQASGIRRTLQNVKPRTDQPYQTMQLIQFNWFREHGLVGIDDGRLQMNYERYPDVVSSLLREVLRLQQQGDKGKVSEFFARWTQWTDAHEQIAMRMRTAQGPLFTVVRYGALGE